MYCIAGICVLCPHSSIRCVAVHPPPPPSPPNTGCTLTCLVQWVNIMFPNSGSEYGPLELLSNSSGGKLFFTRHITEIIQDTVAYQWECVCVCVCACMCGSRYDAHYGHSGCSCTLTYTIYIICTCMCMLMYLHTCTL